MQSTVCTTTTAFVGAYEGTSSGNTLYYSAGGARVAMRRTGYPSDNGLFWIMGDHLGSTSITANADGSLKSRQLYKAFGEVRHSTGALNTKYTYTGQYTHVDDFGLMYYVARWYDPALGRFAQADTVGEGDRYAYVGNNPVGRIDPSGHIAKDCDGMGNCEVDPDWKKDKGNPTVPTTPPSNPPDEPNWGDPTGQDNPKRLYMTQKVWDELCTNNNNDWWGCTDMKLLAAWLLEHEISIVLRDTYYNYNNQGKAPTEEMVKYISYLFSDGVDIGDLAKFTSFFNPVKDSWLDQDDWNALKTKPSNPVFLQEVERYWGKHGDMFVGKKLAWWEPNEPGYSYTPEHIVVNPDTNEPVQYFAIVPFP